MFGRKQKKIEELQRRVEDLEERLCPFNKHDWVEIECHLFPIANGMMFDTVHVYKCRRCGKKHEKIS